MAEQKPSENVKTVNNRGYGGKWANQFPVEPIVDSVDQSKLQKPNPNELKIIQDQEKLHQEIGESTGVPVKPVKPT